MVADLPITDAANSRYTSLYTLHFISYANYLDAQMAILVCPSSAIISIFFSNTLDYDQILSKNYIPISLTCTRLCLVLISKEISMLKKH